MGHTITLLAGKSSRGNPVHEEVPVEPLGERRFRLLQSPGLVRGLVADDVFDWNDDGSFTVVARSGNLCLQVFARAGLEAIEAELRARLAPLHARLDGRTGKEVVFTLPPSATRAGIEEAVHAVQRRFPQMQWEIQSPSAG